MDRKRDKVWKLLEAAWRSPQTADDLETLARMCGRRLRAGGNHPVWVTDYFPHHRPLPIERHGGNPTIPRHAKKVILNGLEADAAAWDELLSRREQDKSGNGGIGGRSEGNS
jgi:hypothetical protein